MRTASPIRKKEKAPTASSGEHRRQLEPEPGARGQPVASRTAPGPRRRPRSAGRTSATAARPRGRRGAQPAVLALGEPAADALARRSALRRTGPGRERRADDDDRAEGEQPARDVRREPVERAPEDVAEHAERRRPQRRRRARRRAGSARSGNFDAPATNGASARTKPMKRPIRIVAPPWRSKKPSTVFELVLGDLQPRAVAQQPVAPEPAPERERASGRRATAHAQTIAISTASEIRPWPATRPPTITAVSPGAMRPTNAPVSRNASAPTSR